MLRSRARHKFKAKPVTDDGHHFPSKLEHAYFKQLQILKSAGEVLFFLRQVPLHLPGGAKYVCDFVIFYKDETVSFVDVKGMETSEFILKKKMVEALYPITIEVAKRGSKHA
jgi:Protein of unknown function (DUF1064).